MANILIVEDDPSLRELLLMQMEDLGHVARAAETLEKGRHSLRDAATDAVLLDYQLPDGTGMELLKEIKTQSPTLPVIMITGVGDTALAIEAMKQGAYDFIRKPMNEVELATTLGNVLKTHRLSRKVAAVTSTEEYRVSVDHIVGQSRPILEICKTIGKIATTNTSVLITGETGTGKEIVARAIHYHSGRPGLFLPVNCSAIVETLLESELFGHEKGSFTGAVNRKEGKFEIASDGTLFLDEIGEMSLPLQAKLLRVLQDKTFDRVGGTQTLETSARIIAATNRNLATMAEAKGFREDLFFRLNVVTLHLPPLRERMEDLPSLVEHLLRKINVNLHTAVTGVSRAAWQALQEYPWPGNVRELENVLTRAVVLARTDTITPELLGLPAKASHSPATRQDGSEPELISLDELEERQVRAILAHTHWHKGNACAILGISRPALERKIKKYGID